MTSVPHSTWPQSEAATTTDRGACPQVLIIEDDPRSARLLRVVLGQLTDDPLVVPTAMEALTALADRPPDLITLDLGLPDLPGLDLLRHIREQTGAPVIIVSGEGETAAVVEALSAGADDYVTKPLKPMELVARARAVLRRSGEAPRQDQYEDDRVAVDLRRGSITHAGGTEQLTAIERRLLAELLRQPGAVVAHEDLLRRVWGPGYEQASTLLHVHISHVRTKLALGAPGRVYIQTYRGIGYEFVAHPVTG